MNTHPLPSQLPPQRTGMGGSRGSMQPGGSGMGPMIGQQQPGSAYSGQRMPGVVNPAMPGQINNAAANGYAAKQRQLMNEYLQEQGKKFATQASPKPGIFSRIFGGGKKAESNMYPQQQEKPSIASHLFGLSRKGGEEAAATPGFYQQRATNYQAYRTHQRGIEEMQKEYAINQKKMESSSGHMQQSYAKRLKAMDKQMKLEEKQLKKDYMNYRRPS